MGKSQKTPEPLRYLVMIRGTESGYSADVPDLPGCVAAAGSLKAVRRLIAEAIPFHLDGMQEAGETIPEPRQSIVFEIDPSSGEEFCTWVEVKVPQRVKS